ncbi:MAG: hypothetical protein ABI333_07845 [bacterium]
MKTVLAAAAALIVGLAAGYLLRGGMRGSSERAAQDRPSAGSRPGKPGPDRSGRAPFGRVRRFLTASRELPVLRHRNAQLVQENQRLSGKLDELKQELVFARGRPAPWPAEAPARLRRQQVVKALNAALKEAGLNGEVTDTDCKEYPCVLAGTLDGAVSAERFKKILKTRALQAYGDDHTQTSITTRELPDTQGRRHKKSYFSIAVILGGPPGTEPEVKRTVFRLRMLLDAATGQ